jgi:scyllo-inositol 2-dehydrogenase (NADP+)
VIEVVPELRVVAAATSRGDEVRRRFPDATVHADAGALLADPAVDAVVVATPNAQHAELARAALEAGKHVVVDKPFVTRPDDGAALIRLARERGLVLTIFHNRRWDGDFLTVEALLAGGQLGEVRLAELNWDRFRPGLREGWKEDPAFEGGLLVDLGAHLLDQALTLFGIPERIAADLAVQRDGGRQDDYIDLVLHYGRARVRVAGSTIAAAARPRFALHGTAGSFVKHGIDPQEDHLRAGREADAPGFGEEAREARGTLTDAVGGSERVPTERGRWADFYRGVAAAVATGAPPPVDPVDALAGLRLMALARESAAGGRVLPVDAAALRAV